MIAAVESLSSVAVAVACCAVACLVFVVRSQRAGRVGSVGPLPCRSREIGVRDILVGTSPLGGINEEMDDDEAEEMVERCVEVGFREFDTAPHYGLGVAEERLGAGLRRGCAKVTRTRRAANAILRDEVRVWTKVGRVIKAKDAVEAGDVVEVENLPGSESTIYLDSPPDAVPVLDYSAEGAARSYAQSVERLGPGVVVAGLRCHDPETPALEAAALTGSLVGLGRLRGDGGKRAAPEAAPEATPASKRPRGGGGPSSQTPLELSIGLNDADVAMRILDVTNLNAAAGGGGGGAAPPRLDSVMLAGRWHLLDQSGARVLEACAGAGVRVEIAGAYASGLLAGGPNYEYKPATAAHIARRDAWAALARKHGVGLKAVALKFAFLPAAVHKAALRARKGCEVGQLQRFPSRSFPLVSADLWTSDHLSERSRRANGLSSGTRARNSHVEATLNHPFPAQVALGLAAADLVDETLEIIDEANAVPHALWKEAVDTNLLPPGLLAL